MKNPAEMGKTAAAESIRPCVSPEPAVFCCAFTCLNTARSTPKAAYVKDIASGIDKSMLISAVNGDTLLLRGYQETAVGAVETFLFFRLLLDLVGNEFSCPCFLGIFQAVPVIMVQINYLKWNSIKLTTITLNSLQ